MPYSVKEMFYTLQGEGANSGRPAVFCRFSGCNLWSGREEDRATAACSFCDTAFVGTDGAGGGKFATAEMLADEITRHWTPSSHRQRFVVLTGGEPLLQADAGLIQALHERHFLVAVETNGTITVPDGIDWVCVSPKANTNLVVQRGNELKLVFPQPLANPLEFEALQFDNFYLQPMDGHHQHKNTELAVDFCLQNPMWRLSVQSHKFIGTR